MYGSGAGLKKVMDPDPVCSERLDPDSDPVNIRDRIRNPACLYSLLYQTFVKTVHVAKLEERRETLQK